MQPHKNVLFNRCRGTYYIYWPFDLSILGEKAKLVNRASNTGDICHYDIENLSDKETRGIFRNHALNANLSICNNDGAEEFSVYKFRDLLN